MTKRLVWQIHLCTMIALAIVTLVLLGIAAFNYTPDVNVTSDIANRLAALGGVTGGATFMLGLGTLFWSGQNLSKPHKHGMY